jgi:hypothetical protein
MTNSVSARFNPSSASLVRPGVSSSHDSELAVSLRQGRLGAASLTRLLDDPALQERLAQAGRERAAQFTWQRTAAATVAAYREALRS